MSGRLWLRSPFESLRVSGKGCVALLERALDGDGALQGFGGGGEGGHEGGAPGLCLGAAVGRQRFASGALVLSHDLACFGVAEALGEGGGAFDVGKEDGDKSAGSRLNRWRGGLLSLAS